VAAAQAARGDHAAELSRRDPALLALGLHNVRLAEVERVTDERGGALADEHLTGRRRLLQTRCDVHGVAGRERAPLARAVDDDLARVHSDPQREAVGEELPQTLEHPQRRLQRPLRVVLLGRRRAEDGNDGIANELLDRAAAECDLSLHRLVEALQEIARVLGIQLADERSGADKIGEQDRRQLSLHRRRG
jgi:hypothetical protein